MHDKYTPKDIDRFWSKVDKSGGPDACWIWTASTRLGYGQIGIGGRNGTTQYAHRLSYELSNGEIPSGMYVCHSCDNRGCCNPNHLFLGFQSDNLADMRRKGRGSSGERHGSSKLSDAQALEIRQRYGKNTDNLATLSKEFGVSQAQISRIARSKSRP